LSTPTDRNRESYNAPEVVEEYTQLEGLSAAEQRLFDRYLRTDMDVLDLGVGAGRTTAALHGIARRYVGIDSAESMVERCRERFPDAEFQVGDAADLSAFDDGSFDAVVFSFNGIDNLHPDETRRCYLRECHRVLRESGVLILSRRNPRAVLEPRDPVTTTRRGSAAFLHFSYCSARRAARTMLRAPFWRGHGYEFTPAHGGLLMARATPRRAVAEIEAAGFERLEKLACTYPRRGNRLSSYWYYFAFRRR
jgi:SAM-dependent methyltransferase